MATGIDEIFIVFIIGMILIAVSFIFLKDKTVEHYVPDYSGYKSQYYVQPPVNNPENYINPTYAQGSPNYASVSQPAQATFFGTGVGARDMHINDLIGQIPKDSLFDVEVTDPNTWLFRPTPKVTIQSQNTYLADYFRGDLPIEKKKDCKGFVDQRYSQDSLNLNGYFSPYFQQKFESLTGNNYPPLYVVNEEVNMQY